VQIADQAVRVPVSSIPNGRRYGTNEKPHSTLIENLDITPLLKRLRISTRLLKTKRDSLVIIGGGMENKEVIMHCPNCNSTRIRVVDTLPGVANNVFRRRKCVDCGAVFKSVEIMLDNTDESRNAYCAAQRQRNDRTERN
jgi:hypothetical protein